MTPLFQTILGDKPVRRFSPYIFGVLVVSLTLHPYVLQVTLHSTWLPYVEGTMNLLIVAFGVLTYYLYERERRASELQFLEASKYIGVVNRKLPLLRQITTDVVSGKIMTAKQKTEAFQKLIGIAFGSIAKSDRGLLRFVDTKTGRTVKEFHYVLGGEQSNHTFSIGNKELLATTSKRPKTAKHRLIVATSDCVAKVRAFLVIPDIRGRFKEDIDILQAIVDQAQMLSRYVFLFSDIERQYA